MYSSCLVALGLLSTPLACSANTLAASNGVETTLMQLPPGVSGPAPPHERNVRLWNLEKTRTRRLDGSLHVPTNVTPPLVVVSQGCSGTTELGEQLRDLLEELGEKPYRNVSWEALWPGTNPFYDERVGMAQAVIDMAVAATRVNQRLAFKVSLPTLDLDTATVLAGLNASMAFFWRSNVLDHLVCEVRDCFFRDRGEHTVDASGHRLDLCFKRRFANQPVKALLNTTTVAKRLKKKLHYPEYCLTELGRFGIENTTIGKFSFEGLFRHESDDTAGALEETTSEWLRLLKVFDVDASPSKVREFFRPTVGAHPLRPSADSIYNPKAVRQALAEDEQTAKRVSFLLRE
eukprot:TRINITY_DN2759_c0_g3_i3.p1 TRINITY_DN2759_c0_g3~~TRINITY_DN2759_c0_g3_i3.p1  ORF type:complete len:377 (-),score=62.19 TRINITY_DN2759_c0_g3_i3:304-1344(-)